MSEQAPSTLSPETVNQFNETAETARWADYVGEGRNIYLQDEHGRDIKLLDHKDDATKNRVLVAGSSEGTSRTSTVDIEESGGRLFHSEARPGRDPHTVLVRRTESGSEALSSKNPLVHEMLARIALKAINQGSQEKIKKSSSEQKAA